MRRVWGALSLLFFLGVASPLRRFQPPEAVSVTHIDYPVLSVAFGTVVLEITVRETGEVAEVKALREIASLTPEAIRGVKHWKFKPATLDGQATAAKATVAVTFNPAVENPANIPLPARSGDGGPSKNQPRFQPPDVVSAGFPRYPIHSVAFGTVVLEATINEKGGVTDVKTLRDIASLTPEAVRALDDWSFKPATFEDKPLRSKLALAFVFRMPLHR